MLCAFCRSDLGPVRNPGRQAACSSCGRPLRCCRQCKHYDPRGYNACREPMADRVVDKERANFCDYFLARGENGTYTNRAKEARQALEALFKK